MVIQDGRRQNLEKFRNRYITFGRINVEAFFFFFPYGTKFKIEYCRTICLHLHGFSHQGGSNGGVEFCFVPIDNGDP